MTGYRLLAGSKNMRAKSSESFAIAQGTRQSQVSINIEKLVCPLLGVGAYESVDGRPSGLWLERHAVRPTIA
jgi:hypothetical protein